MGNEGQPLGIDQEIANLKKEVDHRGKFSFLCVSIAAGVFVADQFDNPVFVEANRFISEHVNPSSPSAFAVGATGIYLLGAGTSILEAVKSSRKIDRLQREKLALEGEAMRAEQV